MSNLYWFSFSGGSKFIGVVITNAQNPLQAVDKLKKLGLYPKCKSVRIYPIPSDSEDAENFPQDKLITREELKAKQYISTREMRGNGGSNYEG